MSPNVSLSTVGVDPGDLGEESLLMQRSWPPPCLDFSNSFLAWSLTARADLPAFIARAYEDGQMVGLGMALPRRFQTNEWVGNGYIKSYMTVDVSHRGRGIGVLVRVALLQALRSLGVPVLRFGEGMHETRARLQADYASASYSVLELGTCNSASTFIQGKASSTPEGVSVVMSAERFVREWASFEVPNLLSESVGQATVDFEARDLRPRAYVGARNNSGVLQALASVVLATFKTSHAGRTEIALIERAAFSPSATAADVRVLADAIGSVLFPLGRGQVMFSNVSGMPWPTLAGAGFRRLPARFSALLAVPDRSHALMAVEGTTVAVT